MKLLAQQKSAKTQKRVQVLYWLKTKQATSVGPLAALVGRHPTTVSRWLSKYRRGRPAAIPSEAIALLKQKLSDPQRLWVWLF